MPEDANPEGTLTITTTGNKEMIRLCPSGNIYIKGKLAENDMDVVDGMREFLVGMRAQMPHMDAYPVPRPDVF